MFALLGVQERETEELNPLREVTVIVVVVPAPETVVELAGFTLTLKSLTVNE
jgi:hypothetical protein